MAFNAVAAASVVGFIWSKLDNPFEGLLHPEATLICGVVVSTPVKSFSIQLVGGVVMATGFATPNRALVLVGCKNAQIDFARRRSGILKYGAKAGAAAKHAVVDICS